MRSASPFLLSWLAMVLASPVSGQAEQGGAGRGDHEPGHASVTDTSSVALGRSLFRIACATCHGIDARGGRGPDLTLGEFAHYLAESLRDPEKEIADGYQTVVAVTEQGRRIICVGRNEDTFSLQMMDADEQLHLLLKRDLREVVHEPGSLMPRYDEDAIDERELQDLVAYLKSLRGSRTDAPAGGEGR